MRQQWGCAVMQSFPLTQAGRAAVLGRHFRMKGCFYSSALTAALQCPAGGTLRRAPGADPSRGRPLSWSLPKDPIPAWGFCRVSAPRLQVPLSSCGSSCALQPGSSLSCLCAGLPLTHGVAMFVFVGFCGFF